MTLQEIIKTINTRNIRERLLIMATSLIMVFMLSFAILIDPVVKNKQKLTQVISKYQSQNSDLETEQTILEAEYAIDPDKTVKDKLQALTERLANIEAQLDKIVHSLIPPQAMLTVLKDIFADQQGLLLISLQNLPPVSVIHATQKENDDGEDEIKQQDLFRHGIRMTFEGDYRRVVQYLSDLETLPWRFSWYGINYQVQEYPTARVTLEIHTFSREKGVVGV